MEKINSLFPDNRDLEKTNVRTHFWLHKGGNTYHLSYTPSIVGTYAMGSSRV